MYRVLVTGANGFIGKELCRRMLAEGWYVRGAVRSLAKTTELPAGIAAAEIDDIGPDTEWGAALTDIDTVVHLAARVHVMHEKGSDPLTEYRRVNVAGTKHLAQIAESNGIRRFVYMSSVKVCGEGRPTAYTEKDQPAPQGPYGISKFEAERTLHEVADKTGLEVVIFRPPLVYGRGVKANFLQMLKVVDRGIPLPLAAAKNSRSFIFLGNLIDAIITCIHHPEAAGKTYLISDGQDISISSLLQQVASRLGKPSRLFSFSPVLLRQLAGWAGKSEVASRLLDSSMVDISKIQKELNWTPPFTVEVGLRETTHWYMNKFRKKQLDKIDQ